MNFLKRAGAIFMLLAIFASSCNKYADDFTQVNTKLDAIASSVAGLATLSTDMAAVKSQITALQTSVAALPTSTTQAAQFAAVAATLTTMSTAIASLDTQIKAVATAGTATKAVVDKLTVDLKALSDKVSADNVKILAGQATAATALAALDVKVTGLDTKMTAMQATMVALDAAVAAVKAGTDANTAGIAKLSTDLMAQATAIAAIGTDLMANSTAATAANDAAVAAATAAAAAVIADAAANASLMASMATLTTDLAAVTAAVATAAQTGTSADLATSLTIQGLQIMLNAQKLQLEQILLNQVSPLTAVTIDITTPQVGSVLTALPVTAMGATTLYTIQWYVGGTLVAGATTNKYTVLAADLAKAVMVKATGTGNALSSEKSSASTTIVAPATPLTAVTFAYGGAPNPGVAQVGGLMTVVAPGAITPNTSAVSYVWESSATVGGTYTAIAGATLSKYYPVDADATKFIRVSVTGTGAYSGTVSSTPSAAVIYPTALTGIAAFGTTPQVGVSFAAGAISPYAQPTTTGGSSSQVSLGNPTIATYQWQSSADGGTTWVDIAGQTAATYTPIATDLTLLLRVKAIGKSFCYGTVVSAASLAVVYPQALTAMAFPTGTQAYGSTLTVGATTPVTVAGTGATYQWQAAGVDIFGATGTTYVLQSSDVGKVITVVATGKNGFFGTVTSAATGAIAKIDVTSPAYAWVVGNNNVTITLTGGTFKAGAIVAADFTFGGANAASFAAGGVVYTRVNDTKVIVTNIALTSASADNTVLVKAATMATQATSVATTMASVTNVVSAAYSLVAANNTITITLVGGTFKGLVAGDIVAGDFTFTGTDNAAIAGATFARMSATSVKITLVAPPGAGGLVGIDNVVSVKPQAMATQGTTVSAAGSTL